MSQPVVGIVMGSDSDWEVMQHRGRAAGGVRRGARVPRRFGAPNARPALSLRRRSGGPRTALSSSPAPAGRRTCPACSRPRRRCRCSACRCHPPPARPGLAALHRADAEGIPVATFAIGEAGAANAGLFAVGHARPRRSGARREARRVPRAQAARGERAASSPPADDPARRAPSACSAAASSAGCSPYSRAHPGLSRDRARSRSAESRGTGRRPAHPVRHTTTRPRLRDLARSVRRGHHRVRERSRRSPRVLSRVDHRPARRDRRCDRAGPHQREDFSPAGAASRSRHFARCASQAELSAAVDRRCALPALLKTARFGYDGKGQATIATASDADGAFRRFDGSRVHARGAIALDLRDVGGARVAASRRAGGGVSGGGESSSATASSTTTIVPRESRPELARKAHEIAVGIANELGLRRRACGRDVRLGRTSCSSTRSRRGRTTAATTRSTPAQSTVRAAGARAVRAAARGDPAPHARRDGEPARRPLVPGRAALGAGARQARRPPASVRQVRAPPGPEDGAPQLSGRRPRECTRPRSRGARSTGCRRMNVSLTPA